MLGSRRQSIRLILHLGSKSSSTARKASRRRRYIGTGVLASAFFLAMLSGCGESEQRQWREAAKVARENRAERLASHRAVSPQLRESQDEIVIALDPNAGCAQEVRSETVRAGVMPVACGNFGKRWPLTVEYGFLRCETARWDQPGNKMVVFTAPSGEDYAVNEAARLVGYSSIAPIFKKGAGPRSQSALVPVGSRLCK